MNVNRGPTSGVIAAESDFDDANSVVDAVFLPLVLHDVALGERPGKPAKRIDGGDDRRENIHVIRIRDEAVCTSSLDRGEEVGLHGVGVDRGFQLVFPVDVNLGVFVFWGIEKCKL